MGTVEVHLEFVPNYCSPHFLKAIGEKDEFPWLFQLLEKTIQKSTLNSQLQNYEDSILCGMKVISSMWKSNILSRFILNTLKLHSTPESLETHEVNAVVKRLLEKVLGNIELAPTPSATLVEKLLFIYSGGDSERIAFRSALIFCRYSYEPIIYFSTRS